MGATGLPARTKTSDDSACRVVKLVTPYMVRGRGLPPSGGGRVEENHSKKLPLAKTHDDFGKRLTDSEMHTDVGTASEGSRTASPVTTASRGKFFRARGGTDSDESGSDTVTSLRSGSEEEAQRRRFRKRRGSDDPVPGPEKGTSKPSKRGRGRPPTTGVYVGLHQARKEKLAEERRAQRLAEQAEADRQISEVTRVLPQLRSHRLSVVSHTDATMGFEVDETTTATIGNSIAKSLEVITKVATKSKNLSGPFIKALKMATMEIRESTATLLSRTRTEETRALEAANARLSKELSDLREELAAVRREVRRASPEAARVAPAEELKEVMERAVREAVALSSARLDARLEGLEARLLPEPRLRPPLASDRRKEAAQGAQLAATRPKPKTPAPEPEVTTLTPPANPGRQEKRKRREKVTAAAKEAAATRRDGPPKTPGAAEGTPSKEWTKVSNRKGQKKAVPPPKKEPKQRRLRAPKSAAVVITLQPEATDRGVSYKDVLERAKKRIDLAAMDIGAVKFKVAVTGARMLEVSGSGCKEKANLLADRLKEVLAEDARISRPQKCAELRVSGLDDSASAPEIAAAIANSGLCAAEECENAPHCVLCADKGLPATHSVGSKACERPTPKKKTQDKKKAKAKPNPVATTQEPAATPPAAAAPVAEEVPMEAQ
ncbi:unnamed protein product [Danaus chrysippus]|uniref:(African queen) hypothetical protein n=1 Tax=Danaus chrysippus TaxID=151541 RepID=A0A8J2R277_9NEOP|nr:unnamed protein product [Danaus chrysippus]